MFEDLIKSLAKINRDIVSDHRRTITGSAFVEEIRKISKDLCPYSQNKKRIFILRMANNIDCVATFFALIMAKQVVFVSSPYEPVEKIFRTINWIKPFAVISEKSISLAIQKRYNKDQRVLINTIANSPMNMSIFCNYSDTDGNDDPAIENADVGIFSSGSTGEPKAILHKIDSMLLNASMHKQSIDLQTNDVVGLMLPLYYIYGLVANLFASLIAKCHVVLHSKAATIDYNWIQASGITVLSLTPFFSQSLKQDIAVLRVITLGGDVLYSKQATSLIQKYPKCKFYATYGLTEAGPRVATWEFDKSILKNSLVAPLGEPLPGVELLIDNIHNDKNGTGELVVKTPTRMLGYYYGVDKGFVMPNWPDNSVYTGDLYSQRHGELFFAGRLKHVIMQGGEKIYPAEVEAFIREIQAVEDVKVEGIIDHEGKPIAKAYVVTNQKLDLKTVRKVLMQQLPHSLIPRKIEFVEYIPRTMIGKKMA